MIARIENIEQLGEYVVSESHKKSALRFEIVDGSLVFYTSHGYLTNLLSFLRDNNRCLCKQLIDIFAIDYPEREERFEVVYNLLSLKYNRRITVKISVDEKTKVPSVAKIFSCATWFEREVWDMNGVQFDKNPDMRRILTDYGFQGHPLRKDFPLTGYVEVHYSEKEKRVKYAPVNLPQEFRSFDFLSPWEGTQYKLPGDEKAKKENK